jgi:hypothetical protein
MSSEERRGQAKRELAEIHEKASLQEAARKLTQQQVGQEEQQRKTKEIEEQKLVDDNWSSIKPLVLRMFQEVNTDLLARKGEIIRWNKRKIEPHGFIPEHPFCSAIIEGAELRIPRIGRVVLYRLLEFGTCDWDGKDFVEVTEQRRHLYIYTQLPHENRSEIQCPKCEGVRGLSLVLTQSVDEVINQIENETLAEIISLHEKALLGE